MAFQSDLAVLKAASAVLRLVPIGVSARIAEVAGRRLAGRIGGSAALARNLRIVGVPDPDAAAARGIGAYARYWVDTLRLPTLSAAGIDRRFSFIGYDHILDVQRSGHTPIMVLPHLGSWEWAAAWLGLVDDQRVIAVVERLEPPELFEWFQETREAYGVEVVPLGADALKRLTAAIAGREGIICLVADRDIAGSGVEVDFFGHTTRLPSGPALLSLRTGNPLLPVAIYDRGATRQCRVGEPMWPERQGKLRDDVRDTTQLVAAQLAELIRDAPGQWHVLSDIWPQELA